MTGCDEVQSVACHVICCLGLTLLITPQVSGQSCSKFSGHAELDKSVLVDGTCLYGFRVGFQYASAEALCNSEGMRLPDYSSEARQLQVYQALGSSFGQHWSSLKNVGGVWTWWDVTTSTGSAMTSPRWEGGSSGQCAYTQTTDTSGKWKAADLNHWYRPVCEDDGGAAETSTSPADITQETTVTSTPTETSTVQPSACNKQYYNHGTRSGLFVRNNVLTTVELLNTAQTLNAIRCAGSCLSLYDCCSISFRITDFSCRLYRILPAGSDVTCQPSEDCYISV